MIIKVGQKYLLKQLVFSCHALFSHVTSCCCYFAVFPEYITQSPLFDQRNIFENRFTHHALILTYDIIGSCHNSNV